MISPRKHAAAVAVMWLIGLAVPTGLASAQQVQFDERFATPFPPGITVQSQCGAVSALQDVENYDGTLGVGRAYVDEHQAATLQLQWLSERRIRALLPDHAPGDIGGQRWCTGTLVSDSVVLTAGHCFDVDGANKDWMTPYKRLRNGQTVSAEPSVLATLQVAHFRYQIDAATGDVRHEPADSFPVRALLEYRPGPDRLDYALIELGRNAAGKLPGELYQPAGLRIEPAVAGETIAVFQHPHGQPKMIEAGKVLKTDGPWVYYNDVDTEGGSSGAAVYDASGRIIAVHTNGGCYFDARRNSTVDANRGVSIEIIAAASQRF